MLRKFLLYAWQIRWQFIRYFAVGVSTVLLDMGSLVVLKEYFFFTPVAAVVLNQLVVLAYNFNLNRYWSFKEKSLPHRQVMRYALLSGFNYFFSVATMYVFNESLGIDYRIVRLGSIAVMVLWNFLLYKYWVFREEPKNI